MQPQYVQTVEELAALVKIRTTPESLVLEFKATIDNWDLPKAATDRVPRLKAEAQQETCRDVAQFANTDGGCLLIGVGEELDHATGIKIASGIENVNQPDKMKQWIEQAIGLYLVPATFTHEIKIIRDARGTVVAVNVRPSLHLVALLTSERKRNSEEKHSIEYLYRDSHGKKWMNPDEVERHIMNGSRATKLAFDAALNEVPTREVRVASGCAQRLGRPPAKETERRLPLSPVIVGRVSEEWFELEFEKFGKALVLPFGVVEHVWVGADKSLNLILSVRVVHVVRSGSDHELTIEPYH